MNIESNRPEVTKKTKTEIKDFWERNVNAEEIYGRKMTEHKRGSAQYFSDLEKQRYRTHTHIFPWIQKMVRGKTVLEIGCGVGMDSFQMLQNGLAVTGIDLTESAIEAVKLRLNNSDKKATFEVGDATDLRFENDSFDYVYSFGVLHHTQDTEKAICEAYRVLKKGGEARIMLYNRHSLNELVHRITGIPFEDKNELCPVVRRFSVREIEDAFSDFDTVVIKKEYVFGEGYGLLFSLMPKPLYDFLSRRLGWHLMITATK